MQAEKIIAPEMSLEDRKQFLIDNADHVEIGYYYRTLTQEDKDGKSALVSANVMEIWELREKLKEIVKEYKDKITPLEKETRKLAYEVKTGQEEHEGAQYHMRDFDERIVHIYDEDGLLLQTRRLAPDEMQKVLKMI